MELLGLAPPVTPPSTSEGLAFILWVMGWVMFCLVIAVVTIIYLVRNQGQQCRKESENLRVKVDELYAGLVAQSIEREMKLVAALANNTASMERNTRALEDAIGSGNHPVFRRDRSQ